MNCLKNLLLLLTGIYFGSVTVFGQDSTQETVWLQLNREIFLAGEQIIFKAELLDFDSYQPSELSKSVRIELFDNNGNIISRQNLGLDNSSTSGSIDLPISIPTGWYYIRSYTNWMRNYSHDNFTVLPIRVLNHNDITDKSLICKKDELRVLLIPHGSLNKNMPADYSIFTSYGENIPVNSAGIAMNHYGDTLFSFATDKSGWGLVETNHMLSEGNIIISTIDNIYPDIKIASKSRITESDEPDLTIEKKHGYLIIVVSNFESAQTYKLMLHRHQSHSWFESKLADGGELVFRIPQRIIPAGISQISLFEADNNLIQTRLWSDFDEYIKSVEIDFNDQMLETGKSYSYEYLISGDYPADSVSGITMLIEQTSDSITKSDNIPGLPGWPTNYNIPSEKEAFEAWINASKYPDWVPKSLLPPGNESPLIENRLSGGENLMYFPDSESDMVQGGIRASDPDTKIDGIYLGLTILSSNDFFTTTSDQDGKFQFELSGNQGKQDYVLGFIESSNKSLSIEIESNFCEEMDYKITGKVLFTEEEFDFLRDQNITFQLKRIYSDPPETVEEVEITRRSFYGIPEQKISPSNYIDLPDIESLIYETVPALSVRQKDNNIQYIQVNTLKNDPGLYPSLILLDGLAYNNIEDLLACSPQAIDSIDIITGHYIHGSTVFDGIVSFRSKESNLGGLRLPSETILSSIILPVLIPGKVESSENDRVDNNPFFEEVLAWQHSGRDLLGKVNFKTNDLPGLYLIRIYGYDRDGKWHSGTKYFRITDN